jgi:DNA-binding NarL/FixJ family response regulator
LVLHITPGERAALQLLADCTSTDALADHLGASEYEVEARLNTLFVRMGATCRSEAIAAAFRRGLLTFDEQVRGRTPNADTLVEPRESYCI